MTTLSESTADAELLRRVALRDDGALEMLYRRFSGSVFAVACRILGRGPEAEEAVQETFLYVWQCGREYRSDRGTVQVWLLMLARSRSIDRLRATAARTPRRVNPVAEEMPENSPLLQLEARRERSRVEAALRALSADQRRMLELAYFEGLSHSEIASSTGVPLGTVKSWIRRGMEQLADRLREVESKNLAAP